jgi:chorismate dehydratase
MVEKRQRFGCHDFLNSRPITWAISEGLIDPPFETVYAPPSKLSDMLRAEDLDFAIIPAIEYARIPGLELVPGFSIAAKGKVGTVLLFSESDPWDAESVAVDPRSRTSVALLQILFQEYRKRDVKIIPVESSDPAVLLERGAAALIIGDEAFGIDRERLTVIDLAESWYRFANKPFVFAVLCTRDGVDAGEAVESLREAKEIGLGRLSEISNKSSALNGIPADVCYDYLKNRISYDLLDEELAGLKLFFELAAKHGLIEKSPDTTFFSR